MAPHADVSTEEVSVPEVSELKLNNLKIANGQAAEITKPTELSGLGEKPKLRLWMMRAAQYPRRVTLLLREKGITDEFDIIWVQLGPGGMRNPEGKPKGQIPILELQRPSEDGKVPGRYLFHSTGIMKYIDMRWPDVNPGFSPLHELEHKALVHDLMTTADEATLLLSQYSYNASGFFTHRPQDPAMAVDYWKRGHETYATLEGMADPEGPYLVPGSADRPTSVDIAIFSTIQNFRAIYDTDLLVGHPRLQKMYEAFEKRPTSEWNEVLPPGLYTQTRVMNPRGSDIPWKKFEIPVLAKDKPQEKDWVLKDPY